jgi:hypothetical protein
MRRLIVAFGVACASHHPGGASHVPAASAPSPEGVASPAGPPSLHADADTGLLAWQRGLGVGPGWPDVPAVASTGTLSGADRPLDAHLGADCAGWAALSSDGQSLALSADYFATDFGRVEVHRGLSAPVVLGRWTPGARAALPPERLVAVLVALERIGLFAHLEGSARLVASETSPDGAWTGRYAGSHVYYTSDRHEPSYAFVVTFASDGTVTVSAS